MILLGSHVGMTGPDYFLGSAAEALSYGENTFMFYTGAPQNTKRKAIKEMKIEEGKKACLEAGIDPKNLVVHAPYIINLANDSNPENAEWTKKFLFEEIQRTAAFGANKIVLHPGAHLGKGAEEGIRVLVKALDQVLSLTEGSGVLVCLETMAGKGSEIGSSFEEIASIVQQSAYPERLAVTLDTCHVHDAGYDVFDADSLFREFDRVIGLSRLAVVHLNDSKNARGSHKDRHENIGYGEIGFEALSKILHHPVLNDIPVILETPYFEGKPPYKKEVSMLLSERFEPSWREKL